MSRSLLLVAAALVGLVAGALVVVSIAPTASRSGHDAVPLPPPETVPFESAPVRVPDESVLLVWTSGGLPAALDDRVERLPRIADVTSVSGGRLDLASSHTATDTPVDDLPDGWAVPLDTLAIDPASYLPFVPAADRPTIAQLRPGTVLLGSTSARLRRLDAGDAVTLTSGDTFVVVGVVDDHVVGGAELVVSRTDARRLGITTERFLLVAYSGERAEIEAAIRDLVDVEIRVRGPGETPYLRHGDAVLPQALVKEQFGEFAYRPPSTGTGFVQDPAWTASNIVTVDVPILGEVRCHRSFAPQLRGALEELVERGLDELVDAGGYAGCHNPRLISPGGLPSRHAWGIAVDLNADANPAGVESSQDPRLVETFARWGLTWGGFWLVPDGMHFEHLGPPNPEPAKVVPPD